MSSVATDQSYLKEKDNKNLDHIPGEYGLPFIGKTLPLLSRLHRVDLPSPVFPKMTTNLVSSSLAADSY